LSNDTPARSPFSGEDPALPPGGFEPASYVPTFSVPAPRPKFQHNLKKHLLLFLVTLLTTTTVGACHYASFLSDFNRQSVALGWSLLFQGLWYSATFLAILGAHEMGHYAYCRKYNVDATPPYFIPLPPFVFLGLLTGTLGAVIRIREPFPTRKILFDIGVAGPIAGFIVLVPAFFIGLTLSRVTQAPPPSSALLTLGEPLLFRWGTHLIFGTLPDSQTINIHPMVFAAWLGMLATALNLLPFGQLDGGHITYATLGRWAMPISLVTVFSVVGMAFLYGGWVLMAMLMLIMLALLGPRHPPVLNESEPLPGSRRLLALVALVMLVLCFTAVPIQTQETPRNPPAERTASANHITGR
jgi:membrane-associated protease RseP (regulator of RpoE activity)